MDKFDNNIIDETLNNDANNSSNENENIEEKDNTTFENISSDKQDLSEKNDNYYTQSAPNNWTVNNTQATDSLEDKSATVAANYTNVPNMNAEPQANVPQQASVYGYVNPQVSIPQTNTQYYPPTQQYNAPNYNVNNQQVTPSQYPQNGVPMYPNGNQVPQNTGYNPNQPYYPPYNQGNNMNGNVPYSYKERPRKQRLNTGVKIFIFVICAVAVISVLGLVIGLTTYQIVPSNYYDDDGDIAEPYTDSDDYSSDDEDEEEDYDGFALPPEIDEDELEVYDEELVLPDIDVESYGSGIVLNSKPATAELEPSEVYEKVIVSTVTVEAKVPYDIDGETYYEDSVGTGIVVTSDGFMLTNGHVIGYSRTAVVTITTHDGTRYPAVVVGYDKGTDLAILKAEDHGFTPAEFGSSDELKMGEWVIAIGNPGGSSFSGSLTRGVVSGFDRSVGYVSDETIPYIQTDAAINPGNSGGPLVNMYGQVIGINTAKIVADDYEGMGFAIPTSDAKSIIDELLDKGYVGGRVRLGILARAVGADEYYTSGLPVGIEIVEIDPDSSFANTEVEVNDVIVSIDFEEVYDLTMLSERFLSYSPGDTVTVEIYRPSTEETLYVDVVLLEDKGETQD